MMSLVEEVVSFKKAEGRKWGEADAYRCGVKKWKKKKKGKDEESALRLNYHFVL